MKSPDKIFIQTYAGEAFSSKWTTIPFKEFENTEYIRKDALLEYIDKMLQSHGKNIPEPLTLVYITAYLEMKVKIESL